MIKEYSSLSRQSRVIGYLQNLNFKNIVGKEQRDMRKTLKKVCELAKIFAQQCSRPYIFEEHKVKYLHEAVSDLPWIKADPTTGFTNKLPWKFEQLYTAIETSCL